MAQAERIGIALVLVASRALTLAAQNRESEPVQPKPYVYQQRYHGHPPETSPGTAPCGARGANCPPGTYPPQHHEDHTGRNVAIGVGAGLLSGIAIGELAHASEPTNKLSENGPQFATTLHMSTFQVTGFLKGGWPLVIDYEAEAGTYAVLTIVTQGPAPYSVLLPTPQAGRHLLVLELPLSLGTERKIGDFTVRSTISQADQRQRYFRVYGFGCGPKAVGSVAIDQLKFGPQLITRMQSQTQFSFHTHTDFDKLKAEFMQVALVDNSLEGQIFDDKKIDRRLREDEHWSDNWDSKKAHPGQIQFRIRGWMTADRGGDWVSAFSPDLVLKQ